MNNSSNAVVLNSLCQVVSSTTASVGTILDLGNYVNVGKRALKLTMAVTDCKLTTTTDQSIGIVWYESATTASSDGVALTGAAISSATTLSTYSEVNVLVQKRYVFAKAAALGTAVAWGVVANAIPLRRDF